MVLLVFYNTHSLHIILNAYDFLEELFETTIGASILIALKSSNVLWHVYEYITSEVYNVF